MNQWSSTQGDWGYIIQPNSNATVFNPDWNTIGNGTGPASNSGFVITSDVAGTVWTLQLDSYISELSVSLFVASV